MSKNKKSTQTKPQNNKKQKKKTNWTSIAVKGMLLFMIIALILSSIAPYMM